MEGEREMGMFRVCWLVLTLLGLGAGGCASSHPGYLRGPLPKIAVAYNLVPHQVKAQTQYGGDHSLAVYVDKESADTIRQDFIRRVAKAAPLPVFAVRSKPLPNGTTCPSIGELASFAGDVGVGLTLCVDRSFWYNDLAKAAVVTTRIGLYSAAGSILWRGASTKGINLALDDAERDIFRETRAAAFLSNQESVEKLHQALALLN